MHSHVSADSDPANMPLSTHLVHSTNLQLQKQFSTPSPFQRYFPRKSGLTVCVFFFHWFWKRTFEDAAQIFQARYVTQPTVSKKLQQV